MIGQMWTQPADRALRAVALLAVLIGLVVLGSPVMPPGFMLGHDGGVHPWYAFLFDRALRQGQFPVRWVEGVQPGLGQPLFNYYQVGFYYLVSLVHAVGPALSTAFKLVIVEQWALGALFMFLLCRPLGTMPAAAGAAVYLWSPYLLLDVYVRSAYPEFTAIGFAPALLWAVDRTLRTGRWTFVWALALFTAWLLIAHLPTAVMIGPVALLYAAGVAWMHAGRRTHLVKVAAGGLLGAGLAAFYVVPAIFQIGDVRLQRMTAGYFDYHKHFVQPRWWIDWSWGYGGSGMNAPDQMSMQIGVVQWCVIAASLVVAVAPPLRRRLRTSPAAIWGILAALAVSMFLMTHASVSIWEHVGPMAFIQFPWRLLMVPALLGGLLAATIASAADLPVLAPSIVIALVAGQWVATTPYRAMAFERAREMMLIDDPQWAASEDARRLAFREAAYDPISVRRIPAHTAARWTVAPEGSADVTPRHLADADLELDVQSSTSTTLIVNTPMFPGWQVVVDGRRARPAVQSPTGYLELPLAAGHHTVHAALGRDTTRAIAESVTGASATLWIGLGVVAVRRRRARSERPLSQHA